MKNEITRDTARYLVVFKERAGQDKRRGTQKEGIMWEYRPGLDKDKRVIGKERRNQPQGGMKIIMEEGKCNRKMSSF